MALIELPNCPKCWSEGKVNNEWIAAGKGWYCYECSFRIDMPGTWA